MVVMLAVVVSAARVVSVMVDVSVAEARLMCAGAAVPNDGQAT